MTLQPVAAMPIDADEWWLVYLRGALVGRTETYAQNVKFDRRVPNPRPARLVVVRKDGGSLTGLLDSPRVSIDVWHDMSPMGEKYATDLSRLLLALAFDAPGTNGCVRVQHLSGPVDVADPSGQPRRQSLIEATHRVAVLT
ncbi:hypothetical protein [Arthrobacter sp. Alg241-R88]|uniref:hypothetical protein n=1 Tax=Arthrobacter sp. Alg241-R88 TaxID=2305984 RepID=UPI0013D645E8|nr:hypothetical protein [Arthrobacter sp. Alg241-R88]